MRFLNGFCTFFNARNTFWLSNLSTSCLASLNLAFWITARSFTCVAIVLSSLIIITALNVVADVVGNKYIGKQVAGMGGGVSRGESLYLTAQRSEIFLPLVLQMIAV
ncbi:hypothetical protein N9417_05650, partial [Pseudomonadales bacterium]|nr:hypothetical protein [Pseudomonadales bacterium]